MTNFDELWVNDSLYTNSIVVSKSASNGWFIVRSRTNKHHKTHNGGAGSSTVGLLDLYS